ncbi:MAG: hypothetical protein WC913_10995, partial [Desulfuromonas sp.]
EFGSWLSPEFKLYLIKEFQRLKEDENRRLSLAWNLNRTLAKNIFEDGELSPEATVKDSLTVQIEGARAKFSAPSSSTISTSSSPLAFPMG